MQIKKDYKSAVLVRPVIFHMNTMFLGILIMLANNSELHNYALTYTCLRCSKCVMDLKGRGRRWKGEERGKDMIGKYFRIKLWSWTAYQRWISFSIKFDTTWKAWQQAVYDAAQYVRLLLIPEQCFRKFLWIKQCKLRTLLLYWNQLKTD